MTSRAVPFRGGHLDGATLPVPTDGAGRPVAELRCLHPVAVYTRAPVLVGGHRVGWVMVAR